MSSVDTFRPESGVLAARSDVPSRYKWDLRAICPDWDAWLAHYRSLDEAIEAFKGLQGTLAARPDALLAAFRAMDHMGALSYRVWYYASLHYDEDQRNNDANAR